METKNFIASVYQLDKTGENTTFELKLKGTLSENTKTADIAKMLSERIFKVQKAQQKIHNSGMTERFFGLAKSKQLYFFFEVDGNKLIDSEALESVKINITKVGEAKTLQLVLTEVMDIFDNNEITL